MSTQTSALANAARLKKSKASGPKPVPTAKATKPAAGTRKPVTRTSTPRKSTETLYPWAKIAAMYEEGKTAAEISDHFGIKPNPGSKPVSRYSKIANILTRLSKGVTVGGKVIKIKRG